MINVERKYAETIWNLEATIQEVQTLAKELPKDGKKLCLFIGRVPGEPFPGFEQTKPENEVWISLDKRIDTQKFHPLKQIHLILDIYDERVEKIKHIFDKVLVDIGTLRHFNNDDNPWGHLKELLKPNNDSQLITEASNLAMIGLSEIIPYLNLGISPDQAPKLVINKNIQNNLDNLKALKQFKSIELYNDTPFPYAYRHLETDRKVSEYISHFIFTGL